MIEPAGGEEVAGGEEHRTEDEWCGRGTWLEESRREWTRLSVCGDGASRWLKCELRRHKWCRDNMTEQPQVL